MQHLSLEDCPRGPEVAGKIAATRSGNSRCGTKYCGYRNSCLRGVTLKKILVYHLVGGACFCMAVSLDSCLITGHTRRRSAISTAGAHFRARIFGARILVIRSACGVAETSCLSPLLLVRKVYLITPQLYNLYWRDSPRNGE